MRFKDHLHNLGDHRVLIPLALLILVLLELFCGRKSDKPDRITYPDRADPYVETETPDVP